MSLIEGRLSCQDCRFSIDEGQVTEIYDNRLAFRKVEVLEDNNGKHKEYEPISESYSASSHVRKEDVTEEFGEVIIGNNYGGFIIPDTYQGLPVNYISPHAFKNKHFASLTIGKNIEGIGNSAFTAARFGSDLIIPDNVKYIDLKAFLGTNLKKVTLGKGVTEIRGSAFTNCRQLEEIILNNHI